MNSSIKNFPHSSSWFGRLFSNHVGDCEFARRSTILVQGRGSAANSAVCYCLGITAVDPIRYDLLFERFLSDEREGYPDIDLDIEHSREKRSFNLHSPLWPNPCRYGLCSSLFSRRGAVKCRPVLGLSVDDYIARLGLLIRICTDQGGHQCGDFGSNREYQLCGSDPRVVGRLDIDLHTGDRIEHASHCGDHGRRTSRHGRAYHHSMGQR